MGFLRKTGKFIAEHLILSVIIMVVSFSLMCGIRKTIDLWDLLISSSFSLLIFILRFDLKAHLKKIDNKKIPFVIELAPKEEMDLMKELPNIISTCYNKSIFDTISKAKDLCIKKEITDHSNNIYNYIVFSATRFKKSAISVDCDLDGWFYVCEEQDFASIFEINTHKDVFGVFDVFESLKEDYKKNKDARRRIDPTYNISQILIERFKEQEIEEDVKRIIVLNDENIDVKEKIILQALSRISKETNKKIYNKVLYKNQLKEEEKKLLYELQDIIVFDHEIAYKEYLINEDKRDPEVIIDNKMIDEVHSHFFALFSEAKNI
jgi:hypothetical protein